MASIRSEQATGRSDKSLDDYVPESRLEELYRRHVPSAIRLAYVLTRDRHLAQDIGHEAFIRVAGRLRSIRRSASFAAYLRKSVVNLVASRARRQDVERRYLEREAALASYAETPDVDTREQLRRALQELPHRQRAAVVLRHYEGLPEKEVARALGCSVSAARSLIARGMVSLRQTVQGG